MNDLEYCRTLSIETSTLKLWIEERWIIPGETADVVTFEDADVARGRLILDLANSMGVNDAGVDVVVDLVDQLHSLRDRMRLLLDAIRQQEEDVQKRLLSSLENVR